MSGGGMGGGGKNFGIGGAGMGGNTASTYGLSGGSYQNQQSSTMLNRRSSTSGEDINLLKQKI